MPSRASHKQHATPVVNLLDAPIPNWRSRLGDVLEEDDLACAFYVLLGNAAVGEIFDDFATPAD